MTTPAPTTATRTCAGDRRACTNILRWDNQSGLCGRCNERRRSRLAYYTNHKKSRAPEVVDEATVILCTCGIPLPDQSLPTAQRRAWFCSDACKAAAVDADTLAALFIPRRERTAYPFPVLTRINPTTPDNAPETAQLSNDGGSLR